MRPVLLEMTGFACFREPTTVSFADLEYFALVGPTGSGKSTVIDAMIFALYGSVPRWEDRRMVSLALAPTVNRGTVRLVFEVGAERYVIARELRRTKNGVNVRNVRLERLNNPTGQGDEHESTEMLASDSAATKRVEQILGLTFENFCTCVVLPQGDFADFLHAKPSDRQKILTNLLGLGVYEEIAKQAGKQASEQAQRAEFLAEQLDAYASATPQAAALAAKRVDALTALSERVRTTVGQLRSASTAVGEADAAVSRLTDERSRLEVLTAPDGLAELDTRLRAARGALASAQARISAAEAADTAARQRRAAAPPRGPLEQVRRNHAELAEARAAEPTARQRHEQAIAALAAATEIAKQARAAADLARTAREDAADALLETRARVDQLTNERDRLAHLAAPEGLSILDSALHTAQVDLDTAQQELQRAETAELAARETLAAAAERGPLEQARRDHTALAEALSKQPGLEEDCTTAARQLATANADVAQAQRRLEQARADREAAGRANVVAELRPQLVAGRPCPVCEQTVLAVPDPLPGANLAQADTAVETAEQELTTMREAQTNATRLEQRASSRQEALTAEIAHLRSALDGAPATADATEAQLAALDQLTEAAHQADQLLRSARITRDTASDKLTAVRAEVGAANQALHTARDPLVSLGAPEVGDHAPTGWATLTSWADQQRTLRDEQLLLAYSDVSAAQQADTAAAAALHAATEQENTERTAETAAARAEQQAQTDLSGLITRIETLQAALSGEISDTAAAIQLAQLDELDAASDAAEQELLQARAAHDDARNADTAVQRQLSEQWALLRNVRDPLVPLGAPPLADEDLLMAWTTLTTWADQQITRRDDQLLAAREAATAARQHHDRLQRSLADDLQSHDVPVTSGESLATDAATAVAAALERARAEQTRIIDARAQADSLSAQRAAAQHAHQVARMLANLLRSDGFPRWLVASALDTLIADASACLLELSGGQFELTHDDGEFLVIDHADADSCRPVKTLSGGETFQASLALALALSEQIATLAAAGAAHLDSIFLDEGFGTLDEATLEVVATTLENLATTRNRMVGVITHVGALADRIPARFTVIRDQRTSTITPESIR